MDRLEEVICTALAEDLIGNCDLTSDHFVPADTVGNGWIEAREEAVVSGLEATVAVFRAVDADLSLRILVSDGALVHAADRVLEIHGSAGSILRAERTALNLLCHLAGVATATRAFVKATAEYGTRILCTRKTTPGLRILEVAAVHLGGGDAYRTNLSDSVLLKDNHIGMLGGMSGVRARLEQIKSEDPNLAARLVSEGKIETATMDDIAAAVELGWRQILLDNFPVSEVQTAVRRWGDRVFLEVSGGVSLANVREYAATGVHAISIGAITHSSRAMDFSLEVEWRMDS
ncbi:carboxylating nicotinate-nucleotide diphosphorylase [bacterium]|nr:carboxylating nicotinate-nucleotide diphosphorylase [bacterium]